MIDGFRNLLAVLWDVDPEEIKVEKKENIDIEEEEVEE